MLIFKKTYISAIAWFSFFFLLGLFEKGGIHIGFLFFFFGISAARLFVNVANVTNGSYLKKWKLSVLLFELATILVIYVNVSVEIDSCQVWLTSYAVV